ncbi:interferon alpha 1 precursor [Arapaima gigas]
MEKRTTFLYEATRNIVHLFRRNLDGVTWNRTETDHFLDVLGQQMKELQTCVRRTNDPGPQVQLRESRAPLSMRHFNYNLQSWELIRKVVRKHLEILELLWASIKNHKSK